MKMGDDVDLMSGVNSMLSTLMSGTGPLAGLMDAPQTPRPKKKGNKKSR